MTARFLKLLILILFLVPIAVNAQRDTVKDLDKVDIYTKYRPVLSDAKRVESAPEMKEPEIKSFKFCLFISRLAL